MVKYNKDSLVLFLNKLQNDIQNDNLNMQQLKNINDFKHTYEFVNKNNDVITEITQYSEDDMRDFIKFLIITWFVFRLIGLSYKRKNQYQICYIV